MGNGTDSLGTSMFCGTGHSLKGLYGVGRGKYIEGGEMIRGVGWKRFELGGES